MDTPRHQPQNIGGSDPPNLPGLTPMNHCINDQFHVGRGGVESMSLIRSIRFIYAFVGFIVQHHLREKPSLNSCKDLSTYRFIATLNLSPKPGSHESHGCLTNFPILVCMQYV